MKLSSQSPPSSPTRFDQFSRDGCSPVFFFLALWAHPHVCRRNVIHMGSFIKLIKLLFNEKNFVTVNPSKFTPGNYNFPFLHLVTKVWDSCSSGLLFQSWDSPSFHLVVCSCFSCPRSGWPHPSKSGSF